MGDIKKRGIYVRIFKRFFDILMSGIAIVLLSPVFLLVALLVRFKLGSPVIFKQERPGFNEKIFKMYKFRTMTDAKDENGELLPDEERLTSFGMKLRSTSLDELPELINIFKGDMSIVGPRPLAVAYLPYYTDEERLRHTVRPGLTGLAQINGRNALSWEDKFKYDIEYVENISMKTDVKIFFGTFTKVFKRENIGQGEEAPVSLNIERSGRENEHYR